MEHEMDWFEKLTGFRESDYGVTRSRLEVSGGRLRSKANEQTYGIGNLETPSLKELRQRAQPVVVNLAGRVKVSCVSGDVRTMHRNPANENALFQVASQFNLLRSERNIFDPGDRNGSKKIIFNTPFQSALDNYPNMMKAATSALKRALQWRGRSNRCPAITLLNS
jgi:hypothetical protein